MRGDSIAGSDELGQQVFGSAQSASSWPSKRLLMKPAQRLAMLDHFADQIRVHALGEVLQVEVDVPRPGRSLAAAQ